MRVATMIWSANQKRSACPEMIFAQFFVQFSSATMNSSVNVLPPWQHIHLKRYSSPPISPFKWWIKYNPTPRLKPADHFLHFLIPPENHHQFFFSWTNRWWQILIDINTLQLNRTAIWNYEGKHLVLWVEVMITWQCIPKHRNSHVDTVCFSLVWSSFSCLQFFSSVRSNT